MHSVCWYRSTICELGSGVSVDTSISVTERIVTIHIVGSFLPARVE